MVFSAKIREKRIQTQILAEKSKEKQIMKKAILGETCLGRVSFLLPSDGIILREIPFGMAVGAYLGPKHIVVAFTKSTQQAGQPDERQIKPTKKLAIGGMAELVHTDLVTKDICLSFPTHPSASPKVDESTQRNTHTIATSQFRREGDAAQGIDTVNLTSQSPSYRIEPSHKGLRQLPSEP